MARLTVRQIGTLLEEVCLWVPSYRNIPLHELQARCDAFRPRLMTIMVKIGEQYNAGDFDVSVEVFEKSKGQFKPFKPWGRNDPERDIRNKRIVGLRDEGLTFPAIGARVGLTESGARNAYEKEKARQINGGQNEK